MTMKSDDVSRRLKLLKKWDYLCIICGEEFDDISSISVEHLVPKSMGGVGIPDNKAPTHYACNSLRGTLSLLEVAKRVGRKRRVMGRAQFNEWVQQPIPNRVVTDETWAPSTRPGPSCLEPPETLPGTGLRRSA
jgi:hypothetical protein